LFHPVVIKDKQGFWKRILIVDDDVDVTTAFKMGIEESNKNDGNKRMELYTSNDPAIAFSDFKPNFYDLLLVDINLPHTDKSSLALKKEFRLNLSNV
jgi:DNA-binding response OmpR family regulator